MRVGGRRLPAQALDGLFEVLSGRVDLDEETGLGRGRPASMTARSGRSVSPCSAIRRFEGLAAAPVLRRSASSGNSRMSPRTRRTQAVWIAGSSLSGLPLVVGEAQGARALGVVGVEALREDALEHRHGEERARDLDQGEPLGVVASVGGRPGTGRRAGSGHQRASSRASVGDQERDGDREEARLGSA